MFTDLKCGEGPGSERKCDQWEAPIRMIIGRAEVGDKWQDGSIGRIHEAQDPSETSESDSRKGKRPIRRRGMVMRNRSNRRGIRERAAAGSKRS